MPNVKNKGTRLTPITFQNEVDVILQSWSRVFSFLSPTILSPIKRGVL